MLGIFILRYERGNDIREIRNNSPWSLIKEVYEIIISVWEYFPRWKIKC